MRSVANVASYGIAAVVVLGAAFTIVYKVFWSPRGENTSPIAPNSSVTFTTSVRAKLLSDAGIGYVAMKSPSGVELVVTTDAVQLKYADYPGTSYVFEVAGASMAVQRAGFPLFVLRRCICIAGMCDGKSTKAVVRSTGKLHEIWVALGQVGVKARTEPPGRTE